MARSGWRWRKTASCARSPLMAKSSCFVWNTSEVEGIVSRRIVTSAQTKAWKRKRAEGVLVFHCCLIFMFSCCFALSQDGNFSMHFGHGFLSWKCPYILTQGDVNLWCLDHSIVKCVTSPTYTTHSPHPQKTSCMHCRAAMIPQKHQCKIFIVLNRNNYLTKSICSWLDAVHVFSSVLVLNWKSFPLHTSPQYFFLHFVYFFHFFIVQND